MAEFIVTSSGAPGAIGFTFEDAVQASIASAGADTIRFAQNVTEVTLDAAVNISGALIIDGDFNGDGISDVVLIADLNRHLNIEATGDVTIRNIDFVGGYDAPKTYEGSERLPAQAGQGGSDGTLTEDTYPLDGADGNDDAGNGTDGADGLDGVDAVGSILNAGSLTLERVGFGGNFARGEIGQKGGSGGAGGSSRADPGETDYVDGLLNTGFGLGSAERDYLLSDALVGGEGGTGGRAGSGANGGDGGDGGDAAAAILNEGTLTLVDTVFAGRLTSGVLGGGNNAYGGSSWGGDGGDSGRQYFSENAISYKYVYGDPDNPVVEQVDNGYQVSLGFAVHSTAPAGAGGDGGIAGNGGTGGRGGTSGDAATIINRGTLDGTAALANNPGNPDAPHNIAEVRDAGAAGLGGAGGGSYGGDGGTELGEFQSAWIPASLDYDSYALNGETPPAFVDAVWAQFTLDSGYTFADMKAFPRFGVDEAYTQDGHASDGVSLPRGTDGSLGQPGLQGTATTGVGGNGTSSLQTNNSLVYVHDLGQDETTGQLGFNIIRVGNIVDPVTVHWELTGDTANPLSPEDFAPGTQLSGNVSFAAFNPSDYASQAEAEAADLQNNVRTIMLDIAEDDLEELPEGYRFTLTDSSGTAILGTSEVTGTAVDTDFVSNSGPSAATDGPDDLTGTDGNDTLDGGAGRDTMRGGAGNDTYIVDNAKDRVSEVGGGGKHDLVKASVSFALPNGLEDLTLTGRGNTKGIGNNDSNNITGNAGHNLLSGKGGGDVLLGGGGNDTLDGGAGRDVMKGGNGNDLFLVDNARDKVVGGNGHDTVKSSTSFALGVDVEDLILTGKGNLKGIGNNGDNEITGNRGNNELHGKAGNDTLIGGGGNDRLFGEDGNDLLLGGGGKKDIAFFSGKVGRFDFKAIGHGKVKVIDHGHSNGTDILKGVELVKVGGHLYDLHDLLA